MAQVKRRPEAHAAYNRWNVKRSPRWRYDRVRSLLDSKPRVKTPIPGSDDHYVIEAYKFLKKWEQYSRKRSPLQDVETFRREAMLLDYPGLYMAYELFLSSPEDSSKIAMEALLLTGLDDKEIAHKLVCRKSQVRWYELIFFNVRDRLHSSRYISDVVIGNNRMHEGLSSYSPETVAKFFGYWCGPDILQFVLDSFDATMSRPGPEQDRGQFMYDVWVKNFVSQMTQRLNHYELNQFNYEKAAELMLRSMELKGKSDLEAGNRSPLEDIASAVLQSIPWSVGSQTKSVLKGSPLEEYADKPAEPRVIDMLKISAGEQPYEPKTLERRLPPPRKRSDDDKKDKQGS